MDESVNELAVVLVKGGRQKDKLQHLCTATLYLSLFQAVQPFKSEPGIWSGLFILAVDDKLNEPRGGIQN